MDHNVRDRNRLLGMDGGWGWGGICCLATYKVSQTATKADNILRVTISISNNVKLLLEAISGQGNYVQGPYIFEQ